MNNLINELGNLYNIPFLVSEDLEEQKFFLTQIINEYRSTFFMFPLFYIFYFAYSFDE